MRRIVILLVQSSERRHRSHDETISPDNYNQISSCYQQIYLAYTASYDSRNRTISRNIIHNGLETPTDSTAVWGIVGESGNYQDTITNNQIDGSWHQGGIKYLGNRTIITDNKFRYNRGEADVTIGGYQNIVSNNSSTNSYGYGIQNIGTKNRISGNTVISAQKHGIFANPAHADAGANVNLCQYIDNYTEDCGADGTSTYDGFDITGTDCIVSNNIAYNNNRYGFRFSIGASGVMFGGNIAKSNTAGQLSNVAGASGIKYTAWNEIGSTVPTINNFTVALINAPSGGTKIGNSASQTIGFYGTSPIAKQTGVAVSAAGIHAALVALGLIEGP